MNGSLRDLEGVLDLEWYGIDLRPGTRVDEVADAATWPGLPDVLFDLVVCTEVLEHAPTPGLIVMNAYEQLRTEGYLLLTCAGPGREAHSVDGSPGLGTEHYANIPACTLRRWCRFFAQALVIENHDSHDLYCLAVK